MTRYLLCLPCAHKFNLHADDAVAGFKLLKLPIKAKTPPNLNIEIRAGDSFLPEQMPVVQKIPVDHLVCDLCNVDLPDGETAIAVSVWKGEKLKPWWDEYGELIS